MANSLVDALTLDHVGVEHPFPARRPTPVSAPRRPARRATWHARWRPAATPSAGTTGSGRRALLRRRPVRQPPGGPGRRRLRWHGGGRIRTCEGRANGFTARPLLPLGNPAARRE